MLRSSHPAHAQETDLLNHAPQKSAVATGLPQPSRSPEHAGKTPAGLESSKWARRTG